MAIKAKEMGLKGVIIPKENQEKRSLLVILMSLPCLISDDIHDK